MVPFIPIALVLVALLAPPGPRILEEPTPTGCYFIISPPIFGAGWHEECPHYLQTEVSCPDPNKQAGMPCPFQECIAIERIPVPGYEDTWEYFSVRCVDWRTVEAICPPCYRFEFPVPVAKLPADCPKEMKVPWPCGHY